MQFKASKNIDYDKERELALQAVDESCEQHRSTLYTNQPIQQQIYREKLNQARAYLADPNAYAPYIVAEALEMGKTESQVAQAIITEAEALWNYDAAVEAHRVKIKEQIRNTGNSIKSIWSLTEIIWP